MTSRVRGLPTNRAYVGIYQKPVSTTRPPGRHTSGEPFPSGRIPLTCFSLCLSVIYPGMTKPTGPEVSSNAKVDGKLMDQPVTMRFQEAILALDQRARITKGGGCPEVIHSKCKRVIVQRGRNDTSNFREHVSVCQANVDNDSLECSPRRKQAPSTHPTVPAPGTRAQLTCLGIGFKRTVGRGYDSLAERERELVDQLFESASLLWVNPGEKSAVISGSCSRTNTLLREPGQPCDNCCKVPRLLRDALRPKTRREGYSPFIKMSG